MKKNIFIVLICISFNTSAQINYHYTILDKRALSAANKKLAMIDQLTNQQLYHLGVEYERLYSIYKDSNKIHAVVCYANCFNRSNGFAPSQERKMAFKLGYLFENGIGVTADTMMAMAWYQLSTTKGLKKLALLKKIFCSKGPPFIIDGNQVFDKTKPDLLEKMMKESVSITIPITTSCACGSGQIAGILTPIATIMKANPVINLIMSARGNSINYPSFAALQASLNTSKTTDQFKNYLVEKKGIHSDRISIIDLPVQSQYLPKQGIYFIEIQMKNDSDRLRTMTAVNLNGWYSCQDNIHCNSNFRFLPDGIYYQEAGCEDRSSISYGQYKITGSEISLQTALDDIPHFSITEKDTVAGSWIRIVDNVGQPIKSFQLMALNGPALDTLRDSQFPEMDSSGYYSIPSGDSVFFSFVRKNKDIEVAPALKAWYQLKQTANKIFTLQFNYPAFALATPYISNAAHYPFHYKILSESKFKDAGGRVFIKRAE